MPFPKLSDKLNALAIISNQIGGVDEVENLIDVPADLLQKAINGQALSNYETALIEDGFNGLVRDPDAALDNNIDLSEVDILASELSLAQNFIADVNLENKFRVLVADEALPVDDIANAATLFANLETHRVRTIIDGISNVDESNKVKLTRNLDRLTDTHKLSREKALVIQLQLSQIEDLTRDKALAYLRSLPKQTRGKNKGKPLVTQWQERQILNSIVDAPDLREMFQAYDEDGQDIWDVTNSLFWAWFREMFY